MIDLKVLSDGGSFSADPSRPTRVAFVHLSPRMALRRRGDGSHRFASHFPGLGLLNLAHSLRVDVAAGRIVPPLELAYFDEECFLREEDFVAAVRDWADMAARPIVAASGYTWTIDYLESFLARFPPERFLLVVGGPHATLAPDIGPVHLVARGEGGAALRHIVNRVLTDGFGQGTEAAGLCFQLEGRDVHSTPAYDRSLEALPSPAFAYDLLPPPSDGAPVYSANMKRMLAARAQIYVCTQSCRARCTFCSTYLIHGRTVARPLHKIRADLRALVGDLGYQSLEFHDDDLLQHPEFGGLLEVLAELGVPWFCYARVPPIDQDVAHGMARAGCRRVFLGVEAMDQPTLDYFNKATTVEQNRRAVEALAAAGIGVVAAMIIGAPHHTIDSILAGLDAYLALPILFLNVSILSPDPGTVEYVRARRRGGVFPLAFGGRSGARLMPDPDLFGADAPAGLPTVCREVSKCDLNHLLNLIELEFYLRPEQRRRFERYLDNDMQWRAVGEYYVYLEGRERELDWRAAYPSIQARLAAWTFRLGRAAMAGQRPAIPDQTPAMLGERPAAVR